MVQRLGQKSLMSAGLAQSRPFRSPKPFGLRLGSTQHQGNQRGIFAQIEQRIPRQPESPVSGGVKAKHQIHWVGQSAGQAFCLPFAAIA